MSVTVKFDANKIYDNIQKSTDVALYKMAKKVVEDTEQFVPMSNGKNKGALRQSATIEKKSRENGIEITYSRVIPTGLDVAGLLYEGKNAWGSPVQHWTTAGTGGDWLGVSEDKNLDAWIDCFREETRKIWRERKSR